MYPGQWCFSKEEATLSTILGSCVGVALYDYKLKQGALNHFLLPRCREEEAPSTRYGDVAINTIIQSMLEHGSEYKYLQAKIYGGASVLSGVAIGTGIGHSNQDIAIEILNGKNIPILENKMGGSKGCKISMNTKTFDVIHAYIGE